MAAKDENIKRLQELAILLGRKADTSGSAADIQQRMAEWEEEVEDLGNDGNENENITTSNEKPPVEVNPTGWVVVQTLKTLHIPALTLEGNEISDAVTTGATVQVLESHFHELVKAGLVRTL